MNHQRNIPAIERNNKNVFTKPQVKDAEINKFTILTTWDLFLLIKGMMKWNWDPQVIRELLYNEGRMSTIPTNYKPIGHITKFYNDLGVFGIELTQNDIIKGDQLGYITPEGYIEESVISLQFEGNSVNQAIVGQNVGIKTIYPKSILRKGMSVYKVSSNK